MTAKRRTGVSVAPSNRRDREQPSRKADDVGPVLIPYIEIAPDPYDGLSERERDRLNRAFIRGADGGWVPRGRLSHRTLTAGYRVLEHLRQTTALTLPEPPRPHDWQVWHLRQGEKREVVAYALQGKNPAVRRTLVTRATNNVQAFKRACEQTGRPWWFTICAELFKPTE